jgi:hypothetical protein
MDRNVLVQCPVVDGIPVLNFGHERIEVDSSAINPGAMCVHGFLQLGGINLVRVVAQFDEVGVLPHLDGT